MPKMTVPAPVLVNPKDPPSSEITPDKVSTSLLFVAETMLFAVNVISPAKLLVTSLIIPPARVTGSAPTVTL